MRERPLVFMWKGTVGWGELRLAMVLCNSQWDALEGVWVGVAVTLLTRSICHGLKTWRKNTRQRRGHGSSKGVAGEGKLTRVGVEETWIAWIVAMNCVVGSCQRMPSAWKPGGLVGGCGMLSELAWKVSTQPAERRIERDMKTEVAEAMGEDVRVMMEVAGEKLSGGSIPWWWWQGQYSLRVMNRAGAGRDYYRGTPPGSFYRVLPLWLGLKMSQASECNEDENG